MIKVNKEELKVLGDIIAHYHELKKEEVTRIQLLTEMEAQVSEINKEIQVSLQAINNPKYPRMRSVADVDYFLNNHGAPMKRIELLIAAKEEIEKQFIVARSELSRCVDLYLIAKNDAWYELTKILFNPIQDDFHRVFTALSCAGKDLISFIVMMNEGKTKNIHSELVEEFKMP